MKSNFGRLFLLMLIVIAMLLSLTGCGDGIPHEEHETMKVSERLVLISEQGSRAEWVSCIYVDRETRVMYWNICGDWKSGLTPILKSDGTPELYDGVLQ